MNAVFPPGSARRPLLVGLVNNASDGALHAVEARFTRLLRLADPAIRIRHFACPPGDGDGESYAPVGGLFEAGLDAVIVTGMKPRTQRLQDEPAWDSLTRIADWAQRGAIPVIWSCLAAHAAVLHLDGIERRRLPAKLSGAFSCDIAAPLHPLAAGLASGWVFPHSRYHDVAEATLTSRGYRILSRSAEAGVDSFVSAGAGLFLFLQGHPEYEPGTLMAEYRRDVRRALDGERSDHPALPRNLPAAPWEPQAVRLIANWLAGIEPGAALEPLSAVLAGEI